MGNHGDGNAPPSEIDEAVPGATAPTLNLDDLDPPASELDSPDDVPDAALDWTTWGIADAAFGSSMSRISDAVLGSTRTAISDAVFGSTLTGIRGLVDTGALAGLNAVAPRYTETSGIGSAFAQMANSRTNIAELYGIGSGIAQMANSRTNIAELYGIGSGISSVMAEMANSRTNIAELYGIGSGIAQMANSRTNIAELYGIGSGISSVIAEMANSRTNIAELYGIGIGSAFAEIVKSIDLDFTPDLRGPLAPRRNLVEQLGDSGLEVPAPPRLLLPDEVAAQAQARDFAAGFRLALAWMQTRGEAASQAILRAATSTPGRAAGLSAALALIVWLSGPSWDDPGDVIEKLGIALGVVFGVGQSHKFVTRKRQD
jgi:hypothetical protein